ncbi:tRNA 2-thiouridine(34) synthase MnmA [Geobacter sp. FeAm09]|uniref:tRNA 2-thiouridine(34) synthase MnmA n=1 Tax=Geobacter sp. FeAm09 TaxID=2597769 RepID=UPI0011EFABCB|nr:tRNA 2-thiouridine(34) synthase MnmA [Geobacter sp. FeAm09]QEM69101.1 tRNA 2-thiouridine(34) synthase MnmA [Geobacter sp. FeAm09]
MEPGNNRRVVVAMSGGVDSSVSAALLKEQGYEVTGVSLQLYDPVPREPGCRSKTCCSLDDVLDAGRVAKRLGIPFEVIDMRAEFRELVMGYFIAEYAAGRTPNPCIRCNELIKFDLLLKKAREMGADLLATGHYARTAEDGAGRKWLLAGLDAAKDQSYFLFTLTGEQLQRIVFPVGRLEKTEVRRLAAGFNLPVAQKHESQEICFIPDNDYVGFLESHGTAQKPGDIVTADGTVVGRHAGVHRYTVGQRKGLGIAWAHPLHVRAIDTAHNRVVVGGRAELAARSLNAARATWNSPPTTAEFRAACRIRYRHTPAPCRVVIRAEDRFEVHFDEPQTSVTPGQAAVLYDGERVLGGGWIE